MSRHAKIDPITGDEEHFDAVRQLAPDGMSPFCLYQNNGLAFGAAREQGRTRSSVGELYANYSGLMGSPGPGKTTIGNQLAAL